jgi:hypothetical protein
MTPEEQLEALRIARERGLLSQKQSAAVQELERRRGIGSGGQMNRRMQNEREPWTLGRAFRSANLATMGVPVVNDLAGLLDDSYMYLTEPESRTWGNAAMSAAGALPFVPSAAGIIAGRSAKTLKPETIQLAEKMRDAGASRDEIWRATGEATGQPAFFDERGQLKFEISDAPPPDSDPFGYGRSIGPKAHQRIIEPNGSFYGAQMDALEHPDLYGAYPDLGELDVGITSGAQRSGSYTPYRDRGPDMFPVQEEINVNIRGGNIDDAQSTNIHELQHAIQGREDYARGGNEMMFRKRLSANWENNPEKYTRLERIKSSDTYKDQLDAQNMEWVRNYEPELQKLIDQFSDGKIKYEDFEKRYNAIHSDFNSKLPEKYPLVKEADDIVKELGEKFVSPHEQYRRLAGEAEARAVQSRLDMPMLDRINKPFWESYDVPEDELIYRYD